MDKVRIIVKAGRGGHGIISFRREKYVPLGGPDGGDGGVGGDIYIRADRNVATLSAFRHKRLFKAAPGRDGASQKRYGRKGDSVTVMVPLGTVIYDAEGNEDVPLADMKEHGQQVLIARGGRGGLGNVHFATATNQAPREATGGVMGEEVCLVLDLKLIADAGIIGNPSVGKSTLLAAVSGASPKAADYPFTTCEPVLGEVEVGKRAFVLAEIPGIIEDAHLGKGLGLEFLRHAERTRVLLSLLDGRSPTLIEDLNKLNRELALYGSALARKPQIVAVNKIDLPEVNNRLPEIRKLFDSIGTTVYFISASTKSGVAELMSAVAELLDKTGETRVEPGTPQVVFRPEPKTRRV